MTKHMGILNDKKWKLRHKVASPSISRSCIDIGIRDSWEYVDFCRKSTLGSGFLKAVGMTEGLKSIKLLRNFLIDGLATKSLVDGICRRLCVKE